jgi:hypothetical protein
VLYNLSPLAVVISATVSTCRNNRHRFIAVIADRIE